MDYSKNTPPSSLLLNDDPRFRITPVQQMAAACTGGMLTSLLMTPLDVIKVRLQAQQKNIEVNKCFLYCNGLMDHVCPCFGSSGAESRVYWYSRPNHFSGTLDAFLKISRYEGISSLWSGLSPTLILALPATVIYFVTYEQLRSRLKTLANRGTLQTNDTNQFLQPFWVPLVAGCTARTWSVTIVSPLELIRTKMQSERLNYLQMNHAIKSLVKHHGIKGLWRGVVPTLLRDVPFSGIYWVTYEKIKECSNQDGSSFLCSFLGGSISGAIAAVITNPFDVVKTLYQINLVEKQIIAELPGQSTTVLQTLKEVHARSGVSGLFTGLLPRLIKVVPACAIMVATFEYGKNYFRKRNIDFYFRNSETQTSCENNL